VALLRDEYEVNTTAPGATLLPPGPVLIVAENASASNGGEAAIPLSYFRFLRQRGADVHLLVHARSHRELDALLPGERGRIHYIRDTRLQYWLWKVSDRLPARLAQLSCGFLIQLITQLAQRRAAKAMVKKFGIDVVHQPTPVSPRMPSIMFGLGAPVVIGPMNGGMSFPPAFRQREHGVTRLAIAALRKASNLLHVMMPGKRKAAVLLVANERTREALPASLRANAMPFCENGVDLSLWSASAPRLSHTHRTVRVVFSGRLIELKGVDLLLEATAQAQQRVAQHVDLELDILGDGDITAALRRQADLLGLNGSVRFHGWQSQATCAAQLASSDVLALPSLCECGGAVVLEAMAMGLPVIAAKWGGPADYVDASCGVLVEPKSRDAFVAGLEDAIVDLAMSPAKRHALGQSGRRKVHAEYDWQVRIDHIIGIYHRAVLVQPSTTRKHATRTRSEDSITVSLASRSAA